MNDKEFAYTMIDVVEHNIDLLEMARKHNRVLKSELERTKSLLKKSVNKDRLTKALEDNSRLKDRILVLESELDRIKKQRDEAWSEATERATAKDEGNTIESEILCPHCDLYNTCSKGQNLVRKVIELRQQDGDIMGVTTLAMMLDANRQASICLEARKAEALTGGTLAQMMNNRQTNQLR